MENRIAMWKSLNETKNKILELKKMKNVHNLNKHLTTKKTN